MGQPNFPWYGNPDVGSAIQDIKKIIEKIETNKFGKLDIVALHNANADLIGALIENDYEE